MNSESHTEARLAWRSRPPGVQLYLLGALVLGTTAVPSGGLLLADPSGATMGLEQEWLAGTPFGSYLVPGLALFAVLGGGSFVVLYGVLRRRTWAWPAATLLGVALVAWITTQVALLRMFHVLQVIYGLLGLALLALALVPSVRADLRREDT